MVMLAVCLVAMAISCHLEDSGHILQMICTSFRSKRVSGCRTLHAGAIRLWNNVGVYIRTITSHKQFIGKIRQKLQNQNAALEHFEISSLF